MAKESEDYKELLSKKYREKGFQSIPLSEYQAIQAKKAKRANLFKIPAHLKFIVGTPFIIIFCFGLFFIPFILYLIFSNPDFVSTQPDKAETGPSYDDFLLKDD